MFLFLLELFLGGLVLFAIFLPFANYQEAFEKNQVTSIYGGFGRFLLAGYVGIDKFFNHTYAALLFWDRAIYSGPTVMARLKYYIDMRMNHWHGKLAFNICRYVVEPWHWGHCAVFKFETEDEHSHYKGDGF